MITIQSLTAAHQRIQPYVHRTPLLSSTTISNKAGTANLWMKCENLQKIGAFKARGAFNKLLQLDSTVKAVCTHSSGNHAQAIAFAASALGLKAYIVMPQNSPSIKKQAVQDYGGVVIESGNSIKQRQQLAKEVSEKYEAYFVHPYDDYDIIAGQGTAAKEVFQVLPDLDYLVFPIGGGGLASGSILATKLFGKSCKPIGVEPYLARDARLSLEKGKIESQLPPISIADGLRTNLGQKTFKILQDTLKPQDVILVDEGQIVTATQLIMERMKLVVQPSAATVMAAVLKDTRFRGKNVCCILSGGNLDLQSVFQELKSKAKL